jgi:hypothetical protein
MIETFDSLQPARVEQVFEIERIRGSLVVSEARRGTEDEARARVTEHTVAVGHTHVRRVGDRETTRARELPGRGDHLVVEAGVPNYIMTPTGAIRVVERIDGKYRVRTVRGDDARDQDRWRPGRCDRRGCR